MTELYKRMPYSQTLQIPILKTVETLVEALWRATTLFDWHQISAGNTNFERLTLTV